MSEFERTIEMSDFSLGEKLKAFRKTKGWSAQQLSKRSGIDKNQIYYIENGHHQPTIFTLECLCRALEIKSSDILDF